VAKPVARSLRLLFAISPRSNTPCEMPGWLRTRLIARPPWPAPMMTMSTWPPGRRVPGEFQRPSWCTHWSSCSGLSVYSITASTRAGVETKCLRGQKCCPTRFGLHSPHTRASGIAQSPSTKPAISGSAHFDGIDSNMNTGFGIRRTSSTRHCFCAACLPHTSPRRCLSDANRVGLRHFETKTT
jgi:hypothetical protein